VIETTFLVIAAASSSSSSIEVLDLEGCCDYLRCLNALVSVLLAHGYLLAEACLETKGREWADRSTVALREAMISL
jgi:hypothetical protein